MRPKSLIAMRHKSLIAMMLLVGLVAVLSVRANSATLTIPNPTNARPIPR